MEKNDRMGIFADSAFVIDWMQFTAIQIGLREW